MVQAEYFWLWLWNEGIAAGPESCVKVWHSRHNRLTCARFSRRGLVDPWGEWQAWQPSVLTGSCSKLNGPALSAWHLKQTCSCAAVDRSWAVRKPPCWL